MIMSATAVGIHLIQCLSSQTLFERNYQDIGRLILGLLFSLIAASGFATVSKAANFSS